MTNDVQYKPFGDSAILITWENTIAPEIIRNINNFKDIIFHQKKEQLVDFIIGYNSLLLKYKVSFNFYGEVQELEELYKLTDNNHQVSTVRWEIPVCYDVDFGFDIEKVSKELNVTVEELIQKHSSTIYTVYFIGFLPGFLYLGGLDVNLEINRKATPILNVPKGSVAIGGKQTGIYPQESAGGWHIIGRTPIDFFNRDEEVPCFAKSGDQVQFKPISRETYEQLEIDISLKQYEIVKKSIHD